MKKILLIAVSTVYIFASNGYSTKAEWLMDINDTDKRFEAIQKQFRGFDTAMMEVGYRYEETKKAITSKNYPLAEYHWDKLKVAVDNGIIRRSARKESVNSFLFGGVWQDLKRVLKTPNEKAVNDAFAVIRPTCNGCHEDQKVGFIKVD